MKIVTLNLSELNDMLILDDQIINIEIQKSTSLGIVVSILERALIKKKRRIKTVHANGKDVFNPADFLKSWSSFEKIECNSDLIKWEHKIAIVTLSIGDQFKEMSNISHPLFMDYSQKIGADFLIIDKPRLGTKILHFEKWQMYDLLFIYDRILFLDTDILVAPNCPDLFDIVPIDRVGGFLESSYDDRNPWIEEIQKTLPPIGWADEYLNSGVGVYSYLHRPIFERTTNYVYDSFYDQTMYNYRIKALGLKIFPLSKEFNRMDLCGPERFPGYIIHYAGKGYTNIYDGPELYPAKVAIMKKDLEVLKKSNQSAHIGHNVKERFFVND